MKNKEINENKLDKIAGGRDGDSDVCIYCGLKRIDKKSNYCELNEKNHIHVFYPTIIN